MLRRHLSLSLAGIVLLFALFYAPFCFGPSHTALTIHDNLNGEVPQDAALGLWYLHPAQAQHLLLAGAVPIYLLPRLTWPLTLLYAFGNPFVAYALTDLIVRLVAALGMFFLARRLGLHPNLCILAAALFSLSLAYSVFGFSIAGIPAALLLIQDAADNKITFPRAALLFFIGWNSALVLTGVFAIVILLLIRPILFGKAKHNPLAAYVTYTAGLVVGSLGLLYAMALRLPLNRDEWILSGLNLAATWKNFLHNQFAFNFWDFYHGSTPLPFLYFSALAAALILRRKQLLAVIALILGIHILYSVVHLNATAELRNQIGGLIKTFQFDRFYLLFSTLIVISWILATLYARAWLRCALIAAAFIQLAWILVLTPQLAPLFHKSPAITFDQYYRPADFSEIKPLVNASPTLSVGLDPMIAVMDGVSAIDGYFSAYPKAYKSSFRTIIARQLTASHVATYDSWGNKLFTFVADPNIILLDFCAARKLGARFVISSIEIKSPQLHLDKITSQNHLRLYSIACDSP